MWGWWGVAGLAGANTVLLLTEQSGGLFRTIFWAFRGRELLGFGGHVSQRWVYGAQHSAHRGGRRLGERGVAVKRRVELGHRLARPATRGGSANGEDGAAALRR